MNWWSGSCAATPPRGSAKPKRPASSSALSKAVKLAGAGRLDEAVKELEGAAGRGENPVEIYAGLGHLRFEQQKWEEAERCYAKVAEADLSNAAACYNLGLALERQSKFEEAARAFENATQLDPNRWQGYAGRGMCLIHMGKSEEALKSLDQALELGSKQEGSKQDRALFGKAVALHRLGRLDEASEIYRKLLPGNANSPELLGNMIAIASSRKDDNRAKELSERLLKIRPQSRHALEGLAGVALSRGDYSAVVQYCTQLVKAAPDSYEGWVNLGVAYQKTGRLEQAGTRIARPPACAPTRLSRTRTWVRFCRSEAIWRAPARPTKRPSPALPTRPACCGI